MTKQAQRTPGPWRIGHEATHHLQRPYQVWAGPQDCTELVAKGLDEDNAAFIVRACNAHDDLVAALRSVMAVTDGYKQKGTAWDAARAALAKTGEGACLIELKTWDALVAALRILATPKVLASINDGSDEGAAKVETIRTALLLVEKDRT